MDAEGLGRKLLLTPPPGGPRRTPEKQTGRGEAFGCPPAVCPAERPRPFTHYSEAWGSPQFQENPLGVKRPFSELSESSGVFSEQLSEFEIPFSEYEIPFSECHPTTWAIRQPQFSEQLPQRFPELMGTHMKDFHLPLHSRSIFSKDWVAPALKSLSSQVLVEVRVNFFVAGAGTTPIPMQWENSDQNSDHGEFEPPEFKSTVNL